MNKTILISIAVAAVLCFIVRQMVYKPYMWKKTINSEEHQLQLGSFIFSKQRASNGSQSNTTRYFIFKVTEINGDFVRLSVIRKLSKKDTIEDGDFSTKSADYNALKQNIRSLLITAIQQEDIYKGEGPAYMINDYLLKKYPDLKKSRYYYEEVPKDILNKHSSANALDLNAYFNLVYSKKEILEKGKLTPWIMNNSLKNAPEIAYRLSNKIDLILN